MTDTPNESPTQASTSEHQPAPEDTNTTDAEQFRVILAQLPDPARRAFFAAFKARSGERYEAALAVLTPHYEQPQELAKRAAILAASMVEIRATVTTEERSLIASYRGLPPEERERVFNFLCEAKERAENAEASRQWSVIEDLHSFLLEHRFGTADEELEQMLDITAEQHERYKAAWIVLQDLHSKREEVRQAMRMGGDSGA